MSDLLSNHKQRLALESSFAKLETNPLYQTLDSTGGTQFSAVPIEFFGQGAVLI